MIKNIIFDYNGVISNDFVLVYKTSMELFKEHGLKKISVKEFRETFEIPVTGYWKKRLPDVDFDELNDRYFELYKTWGTPRFYNNSVKSLKALFGRKNKMFILSSHKRENILRELKKYGVPEGIFVSIYGDVHNKLDVIDTVMRSEKLVSRETVYIGDTEHDLETGKSAGLVTVATTYGYRTRFQLEDVGADYYISDISELQGVLNRLV